MKHNTPDTYHYLGWKNPKYDRLSCKLCEEVGESNEFTHFQIRGPLRRSNLALMIQHMIRFHAPARGSERGRIKALIKALEDVIDFGEHGARGQWFSKKNESK